MDAFSCFTKVAKLAKPPIFLDSLIQGAILGKRCACKSLVCKIVNSFTSEKVCKEKRKIRKLSIIFFNIRFFEKALIKSHLSLVNQGGEVNRNLKWWVWEDLNFRPHPYQGGVELRSPYDS